MAPRYVDVDMITGLRMTSPVMGQIRSLRSNSKDFVQHHPLSPEHALDVSGPDR